MNPTYLEPVEAPKPKKRIFRAAAKLVWGAVAFNVWRLVPGYRPRHPEDTGLVGRVLRWVLVRSAAAITAVVAVACGLVYFGTHPTTYASGVNPGSLGLYFESVTVPTPDGLTSEAWLVPVLDAQMVLKQKEYALGRPRPAAVLLHDFGQTREQMLSLIKPLHDAGIVVLVPAMRSSASGPAAGHTFGLNESKDVLAAIALIKRRAYVDEKQITLVGTGTGATAALLAATQDPAVRAVVVRHPFACDDIPARLGPQPADVPGVDLAWVGNICKWAFELGYGVDAEEINIERQTQEIGDGLLVLKPGEYLDGRAGRKTAHAVAEYFVRRLEPTTPAVADIKGN
jgi:pimeloyl-ACP methyl ester carboxylesterase